MKEVIIDTNLIIELTNGSLDPSFFSGIQIVLSAITLMELYALAGISKSEEETIDTQIKKFIVIPCTATIAKRCGILARTRNNRRHRVDLIIAATALELDMPLLTRNKSDFRSIKGLSLL